MTLFFAVQEHLIAGNTLIQKWDAAQNMGFDGIELRGEGGAGFHARLPELKDAYAKGAVFPSVCVIMDHFIGDFDPARRTQALTSMKTLLSVIAEVGGKAAITPASYGMHSNYLPPFQGLRDEAEDKNILIDMLGKLGDHAKSEGVFVLLEPLNRYEDHMINTLAQGVALLKQLNHPSVKLMADLFHMNIEEANSAAALEAVIDVIAHIHIADSNRLEPGQGHIDFAAIFTILKKYNFKGACAIECLLSGDKKTTIKEALKILHTAELQA